MSKYWLLVAMLGTMACSGTVDEDGGSNQAAVNGKDGDVKPGTEPADGVKPGTEPAEDVKPGTEPTGDVKPGTEPVVDKGPYEPAEPYDCTKDLQLLADASAQAKDPEQLAMIKQKYEDLRLSCETTPGTEPPKKDPGAPAEPYDCTKDLELLADASAAATDPEQLAMIKNKYLIVASLCEPAADPGSKDPGTKPEPGDDGTKPTK